MQNSIINLAYEYKLFRTGVGSKCKHKEHIQYQLEIACNQIDIQIKCRNIFLYAMVWYSEGPGSIPGDSVRVSYLMNPNLLCSQIDFHKSFS